MLRDWVLVHFPSDQTGLIRDTVVARHLLTRKRALGGANAVSGTQSSEPCLLGSGNLGPELEERSFYLIRWFDMRRDKLSDPASHWLVTEQSTIGSQPFLISSQHASSHRHHGKSPSSSHSLSGPPRPKARNHDKIATTPLETPQ